MADFTAHVNDMTVPLLVASTAVLVSVLIVRWRRQVSRMPAGSRHPPCLPSVPIFGSLPFVEKDVNQIPRFLMEQSTHYGNVFAMYLGSRYAVVLNGFESITLALLNQSTQFAERGVTLFGSTLNEDLKGIIFARYNSTFRHKRQQYLSILKELGFGQSLMETRINVEVAEFVSQAKLKGGQSFDPLCMTHMCVLNVIVGILTGRRYTYGDPNLVYISDCIRKAFASVVQELELFPVLQYVPPFRARLQRYRHRVEAFFEMVEKEIDGVIQDDKQDEPNNSFIRRAIESSANNRKVTSLADVQFDRQDMIVLVRDFFVAGDNTMATTLLWVFVSLANNPDVQKRLQAEVDDVVGPNRQPLLDDESNMPYTRAVILETLRLHTPLPLSLFRATTCDTVLGEFFIPAETIIISNLYSAHMDPIQWSEPNSFKPERFIDEHGEVVNKEKTIPFSLGKRSCLGEPLARQELFLFLTGIVQNFDIRPPDGQHSIDCSVKWHIVAEPTAFEIRFIPREH